MFDQIRDFPAGKMIKVSLVLCRGCLRVQIVKETGVPAAAIMELESYGWQNGGAGWICKNCK